MIDVLIECARALLVLFIVLFLWRVGQDNFRRAHHGWNFILGGFSLILLGSVFDITDNFQGLNKFVVIGNTGVEAFIKNVVGYLGGFVLLAVGLLRGAPSVKNMSRLIATHEQTEKALSDNEKRFQAVVNHSPAKIHIKDAEGRYLLVNREAEKLFGVTDDEARGKTSDEIFAKERAASFMTHDQEVLTTGRSIEQEEEWECEDGTHTFLTVKFPIVDSSGGITAVGGIGTDITKRKQAEARRREAQDELELRVEERTRELRNNVLELEDSNARYELQGQEMAGLAERISFSRDEADRANKAKSEFLTTMNHELRTPLNAIIGFSEIIKGEKLGPVGAPEYCDYATDIFDSGHHLLKLINDLLDLSKIEAGKFELNDKDFGVVQVMQSCLRLVGERAQKGNLKLLADIPDSLPMLRFDELKFKQVMLNLMSNAVKFTPEGGSVTIKAWSEPESGYFFQIIDTGIGVAPEDIPKAFSSFGQIDSQLAKRYEGSGLGLPISKALIELGRGILEMQSEVGKGTTMTIRFPRERIVQNPPVKVSSVAAE